MDELSPSPQQPQLAAIAHLLRKEGPLRKGLRAALPGVDWLLGEPEKGFENLSYGDKPWNTRANEPLYDPEKTPAFIDAVAATPFAALAKTPAAAATATFLPIIKTSAPDLLRRAKAASKDMLQGARSGEIHFKYGLSPRPQLELNEKLSRGQFDTGEFMHEIDDSTARFTREALLSDSAKQSLVDEGLAPDSIIGQDILRKRPSLPIPASFDHPALYDAVPELRQALLDTKTVIPGKRSGGTWYKAKDGNPAKIWINPLNRGLQDQRGMLLHELGHGVDETRQGPRGGSSQMFDELQDPQFSLRLQDIQDELRKRAPSDPHARLIFNQLGAIQEAIPYENYTRLAGEQSSNATEARRNLTALQRQEWEDRKSVV